jgi:prevent-host-death family protein
MEIPISEAKAHLADLVRRAEAGDDVVLTRHGHPVARIVPVKAKAATPEERKALLDRLRASWTGEPTPGPDAARSQDFLYDDEFGLPK